MSFYKRYAECCLMRGISPVSQFAADRLGCTKSNISAFARNGNTPKGDVVAGAAKMLDISADYLLGVTEIPVPIQGHGQTLSANEKNALIMLHELNPEGQTAAVAMIEGLLRQGVYKKGASPVALSQSVS